MEGTTFIREHVCNSCGAPLRLDTEKQILVCTYCGVTHDYAYYLNEDSVFVAYSFLRARNFSAASRTFSFILQKDPHNIRALRGLMLASLKITSIRNIHVASKWLMAVPDVIRKDVIGRSPDEYKEYFNTIVKYLELGIKKKETKDEIAILRKKDKSHNEYEYEITEYDSKEYAPDSISNVMFDMYFTPRGELSGYGASALLLIFIAIAAVIFFFVDMGTHDADMQRAITMSLAVVIPALFYALALPRLVRFANGFHKKHHVRKAIKSVKHISDDEVLEQIAKKENEITLIDEKLNALKKKIIILDVRIEKKNPSQNVSA